MYDLDVTLANWPAGEGGGEADWSRLLWLWAPLMARLGVTRRQGRYRQVPPSRFFGVDSVRSPLACRLALCAPRPAASESLPERVAAAAGSP